MNHILEAQQFSRKDLDDLFVRTQELEEGDYTGNMLRGNILASLFYEPSTRTRFSFESAMLRLGGNVISTENAKEFSSAIKGESIEDSIRVVSHYADVIVLRHYEEGMAKRAATVATVPIINAGDGPGQHPTQALLDLYTILREKKGIDGTHIAMVGDPKHSRTIHSLCYLLANYKDIRVTFVSLPNLQAPESVKKYMNEHDIAFSEAGSLDEVVSDADVIYMTRVQKERFSSDKEYESSRGKYILTREHVDAMKNDAIVMDPLPRVDSMDFAVDESPKAVYFKQAKYGVYVRMALLTKLLGE